MLTFLTISRYNFKSQTQSQSVPSNFKDYVNFNFTLEQVLVSFLRYTASISYVDYS